MSLGFAIQLLPVCPHCEASLESDSTTDLCWCCGKDVHEPTTYEREEEEAVMRQGELEIYRAIMRGELP